MEKVIIGDIHGNPEQLLQMLEACAGIDRSMIFLGDYVNRGSNSELVIDVLVHLWRKRADVTFLCGNHDWAFLQYLKHGNSDEFLRLGGLQTISSYIPEIAFGNIHERLLNRVEKAHLDFLENLLPYFEDELVVCSHTGINPQLPESRTFSEMVIKPHVSLFEKAETKKFLVCGHYVQGDLMPFQRSNFFCLDTGCGTLPNGRLTALFLPEKRFLQIDHLGQRLWSECTPAN